MDGVININKPVGITSFKTVSVVKRLFGAKKAGHTGTLDPIASGVLPVCIDKATRIGQYLLSSNKVYRGKMKLGIRTDTQDSEGKVIERHEGFSVTTPRILEIFSKYTGEIEQIPPMFSAKKVKGKKLYELARQGIVLEREPKTVKVIFLSFLGLEDDEIHFRAETSSGTYIRTLCDSIGQDLGCGAHLCMLVRERVGSMEIKDAVSLDSLKELKKLGRQNEVIRGLSEALSFLPAATVVKKSETDIKRGRMLVKGGITGISGPFKTKDILRMISPGGRLIALVESMVGSDDYLELDPCLPVMRPKKVFYN